MKSIKNSLVDPYQAALAIYNDTDIDNLISKAYPGEKQSRLVKAIEANKEEINEFLKKKSLPTEKWTEVDYEGKPFYISNKGRSITTYRGVRFRQSRFLGEEIVFGLSTHTDKVNLQDLMHLAGFEYDNVKIMKTYKHTDYPVLAWSKTVLNLIEDN